MTWIAIPIIAFVVIFCIVLDGYLSEQKRNADRKFHTQLFIPPVLEVDDDYDKDNTIECETSDEPILNREEREHHPKTYAIMDELENTIKIHKPYGGYKSFGIGDMKLKEEMIIHNTPFDHEKKVFVIQCSKDAIKYDDIKPCALIGGNRLISICKDALEFPLTLDGAFRLLDLIVRSNAISLDGETGYKYWSIGISQDMGFATWFDGSIDGKPLVNYDNSINWNNFNSYLEI